MSFRVACAKGCGHTIEVTDEVLDEAKKHGSALNVAHEKCPTEEDAPKFRFRIVIKFQRLIPDSEDEQWEDLATMGDETEAGSFQLALPTMQENLNTQWSRIVGMAPIVDEEHQG